MSRSNVEPRHGSFVALGPRVEKDLIPLGRPPADSTALVVFEEDVDRRRVATILTGVGFRTDAVRLSELLDRRLARPWSVIVVLGTRDRSALAKAISAIREGEPGDGHGPAPIVVPGYWGDPEEQGLAETSGATGYLARPWDLRSVAWLARVVAR